jgi:hypothetical protein
MDVKESFEKVDSMLADLEKIVDQRTQKRVEEKQEEVVVKKEIKKNIKPEELVKKQEIKKVQEEEKLVDKVLVKTKPKRDELEPYKKIKQYKKAVRHYLGTAGDDIEFLTTSVYAKVTEEEKEAVKHFIATKKITEQTLVRLAVKKYIEG